MQDELAPGDEIITAGGIHGDVREVDERGAPDRDRARVVVTLDRRAVAAVSTSERRRPQNRHRPETLR